MHIFIAGIMQASRLDHNIESQDYRVQITRALQTHVPNVKITDPWALNPGSVNFDEDQARNTFLSMTRFAAKADVLIAYLPVASLGTAMEMWQAFESNTYIVTVSPMTHNWAIRFTSDEIHPDLPSLLAAIENGRFRHWRK